VHAEDGPLINFLSRRLTAAGAGIEHLPDARPDYSEGLSVEKVGAYAQATGCKLYIVHLASLEALEAVRRARRRGVDVTIETRPTYLFWTRELYALPEQAGRRYVFRPPLREQRDQDALWEAIAAGEIQVYATDHTSWLLAEKMNPQRDFVTIPGGLSLVETSLCMLYAEGVMKGRITLSQLVALTSTNPAKQFGMHPRKGEIAVGSDADLVVLDPERSFTITSDAMQSRADFDPYEGVTVEGWPVVTISRGRVIVDHGELHGTADWGRLLERD
jgi:dihydropyrimidinase